jgi:hypothetical protein
MDSILNHYLSIGFQPNRRMYFDPVTATIGTAVGGMLFQGMENDKNRKSANKAQKGQNALIGRQTELFDYLSNMVKGHDQAGGFDPAKQLEQLATDTKYYSELDMGNAAGAARTLGYRPGDSEPIKRIQSIDSGYKLRYGQLSNQIRESAFGDKINAYRAVDPTALNGGIQAYGNQAQMYQGRMQNPANMFASIGPYLQQNRGGASGGYQPRIGGEGWENNPFYH